MCNLDDAASKPVPLKEDPSKDSSGNIDGVFRFPVLSVDDGSAKIIPPVILVNFLSELFGGLKLVKLVNSQTIEEEAVVLNFQSRVEFIDQSVIQNILGIANLGDDFLQFTDGLGSSDGIHPVQPIQHLLKRCPDVLHDVCRSLLGLDGKVILDEHRVHSRPQ